MGKYFKFNFMFDIICNFLPSPLAFCKKAVERVVFVSTVISVCDQKYFPIVRFMKGEGVKFFRPYHHVIIISTQMIE